MVFSGPSLLSVDGVVRLALSITELQLALGQFAPVYEEAGMRASSSGLSPSFSSGNREKK